LVALSTNSLSRMGVRPSWLVLSDGARPTEDIYFLASVEPLLRRQGADVRWLDVRGWRWLFARGALARCTGANLLLCRSLPERALAWLERSRARFGQIVYLIDDDLAAAAADPTLPAAYRARMALAAGRESRLLAVADAVVASSDALAARFDGVHGAVSVMTPPLIAPLPERAHFDVAPSVRQPWRIGFHGTRAHLADLVRIAPALAAVQRGRDDTELELMLGAHVPEMLAGLPRLRTPAPLPWDQFRAYQASRRVHIGLAPLLDTPFNRGKSFIKFLDIAAMGGVGVYSRRAPYTGIVEHGVNGLLASDDPDEWYDCLQRLLDRPDEAAQMAAAAADKARALVLRRVPAVFDVKAVKPPDT